MKKLVISLIVFVTLGSTVMGGNKAFASEESLNEIEQQQTEMIDTIGNYVYRDLNGMLVLKEMPNSLYKAYDVEALENHFEEINQKVSEGKVIVNEDLSITSLEITSRTVHGRWTYHWWGYDRFFNNTDAKNFSYYLGGIGSSSAVVAGLTRFLPPVSWGASLNGAYYGLMANRVNANNYGRGVYVGITWALVFNVNPL